MGVQKIRQQQVIVSGTGDSKQHAFASALGEIQKKMMQESEVLLKIEPVKVDVLKAVETSYTEHFLFFFFPRKRTNFEVKLAVTVDVIEVDLQEVAFKQLQTNDPNGINVPFVSKKI